MLYSREIAFAAAEVYARAAEQRGAWDARLEALIVDSVLRGEADEAVRSRATALGWASTSGVCVVLGITPDGRLRHRRSTRSSAPPARTGFDALCAVQGDRLVVVLGGVDDPDKAASSIADYFGAGAARDRPGRRRPAGGQPCRPAPRSPDSAPRQPGPRRRARCRATTCSRSARSPVTATPGGSSSSEVYQPLVEAGSGLLETLTAYLDTRGSIEATGRVLFVHPNTVRYRLKRIADVTGTVPIRGPRRLHAAARAHARPADRRLRRHPGRRTPFVGNLQRHPGQLSCSTRPRTAQPRHGRMGLCSSSSLPDKVPRPPASSRPGSKTPTSPTG